MNLAENDYNGNTTFVYSIDYVYACIDEQKLVNKLKFKLEGARNKASAIARPVGPKIRHDREMAFGEEQESSKEPSRVHFTSSIPSAPVRNSFTPEEDAMLMNLVKKTGRIPTKNQIQNIAQQVLPIDANLSIKLICSFLDILLIPGTSIFVKLFYLDLRLNLWMLLVIKFCRIVQCCLLPLRLQ